MKLSIGNTAEIGCPLSNYLDSEINMGNTAWLMMSSINFIPSFIHLSFSLFASRNWDWLEEILDWVMINHTTPALTSAQWAETLITNTLHHRSLFVRCMRSVICDGVIINIFIYQQTVCECSQRSVVFSQAAPVISINTPYNLSRLVSLFSSDNNSVLW